MKHYEDVTVPERVEKRHTKTTCDLCKLDIPKPNIYKVNDIEISRVWGSSYPEGSWGHCIEIDMCEKCWKEKFEVWLREQGVDVKATEYDWG